MNAIIPDIETLRKVVKINSSFPYDAIQPFIDDALDIYIEPQIGNALVEKAKQGDNTVLKDKLLRALGPLALLLATPELSVRLGDSGFTVDNVQGKYSPANETKIAKAKEGYCFRGMQALDRLLDYLNKNPDKYPEYITHQNAINGNTSCFIRSAQEYQDKGLVNIEYSTITYRIMLPTLRQIQEHDVCDLLGDTLYEYLRSTKPAEFDAKRRVLFNHVVKYMANKVAELYTSQTSREQRTIKDTPEFTPIIRPIYQDMASTGNYFATQADYYAGKIQNFIIENAIDLGIEKPGTAIDFNSKEKKLFTSIS